MIPLHVLTGFLGSGKTTILSALLQAPGGERTAVLVNEVGELSIDHHLLEEVEEDVLALPSGCLCCTLRSELAGALSRLVALRPDRIVVETTGLADPGPILHALTTDPRLSGEIALAGVVTVVDAARLEALVDAHPEVRRQLDLADRVVLTKGDVAPERVTAAHEALAALAPGCEVREAVHGRVDARWLLADAPLGRLRDAGDARRWLEHGPHAAGFRTHVVRIDEPARVDLVQLWLGLVTQLDGPRLLRVKGLVECVATGDVYVLQSAGHALSPPRKLRHRPFGLRGMHLVLIERGLPATVLARALTACRDAAAGVLAR